MIAMASTWPPLPREILADERGSALVARLGRDVVPLWRDGTVAVPAIPFGPAVADALAGAYAQGDAVLGLEAAATALDRDAKGEEVADLRAGRARPPRVSRLLLLASDGAERFYRHAERLTRRHATRLLTCRLGVPAAALGRAVLGRPAPVKAVLLRRKDAVTRALRAIAGDEGG